MVVKLLIFNFFIILIIFSYESFGKTMQGKAKIIDGDTVHINNNKLTKKPTSASM